MPLRASQSGQPGSQQQTCDELLTGGAREGPYKSSRFRIQLGTSEARLVVNGKSHSVASVSNGVGYEITPTKVRRLARSKWPSCAKR